MRDDFPLCVVWCKWRVSCRLGLDVDCLCETNQLNDSMCDSFLIFGNACVVVKIIVWVNVSDLESVLWSPSVMRHPKLGHWLVNFLGISFSRPEDRCFRHGIDSTGQCRVDSFSRVNDFIVNFNLRLVCERKSDTQDSREEGKTPDNIEIEDNR